MLEVCLNINVNRTVGSLYKCIAKNAIYYGNVDAFVSENITMIGYSKIYNEQELWNTFDLVSESSSHNIVVELYKKYGFEDMMKLIEGDYSFLLLDYNLHGEESWLYVVRDPFGISPLYFYANTSEYSFSFTPKENYHPFIAGHSHKFSHSHKVSSIWKPVDKPQSFYKSPFFSIYKEIDAEKNMNIQNQIDMSIKKRVDWIHYKYPEVGLDIGMVVPFNTNPIIGTPFLFLPIIPSEYPKEELDLPTTVAKYLTENMPTIKHVFIVESFTKDWMEKKYLDRCKQIPNIYLEVSMQKWTNVFLKYGIQLYMPFLDQVLIQNVKPEIL